jgi:hypothetical protein
MWKRDVGAGFTGFAAAMTLFAMAHYLATPRLAMAAFLVLSAAAFMAAIVSYAVAVAKPRVPEVSAPPRAPATVVSSSVA